MPLALPDYLALSDREEETKDRRREGQVGKRGREAEEQEEEDGERTR